MGKLSECCDAREIPETDFCSRCKEHAVFYREGKMSGQHEHENESFMEDTSHLSEEDKKKISDWISAPIPDFSNDKDKP